MKMVTEMARSLILEHFASVLKILVQYAKHTGLMSKNPDVLGLAREGFIKLFLSENLPSLIEYKTGQIIDYNNKPTGQIDIVLQSSTSPKIHLHEGIQLSLVDSVLGIIEVKSDLTTAKEGTPSHLKSALDTFHQVKNLERKNSIKEYAGWEDGPLLELKKIPCFLVAYKGPIMETLISKLEDYGKINNIEKDDYWPEVVVVLSREYYITKNDGWLFKPPNDDDFYLTHKSDECLFGLFVYICQLIEVWYEHRRYTNFSKYLKTPIAKKN